MLPFKIEGKILFNKKLRHAKEEEKIINTLLRAIRTRLGYDTDVGNIREFKY